MMNEELIKIYKAVGDWIDPDRSRREKIISKVFQNCRVNEDGCFIWQGGTSGNGRGGGYGRISIDGGTMAVHKVIWICFYGPVPPRKQIDHECNNRLCCNPKCLTLVTHKQNQKRRDQRKGQK